jgi:hypothetical protein
MKAKVENISHPRLNLYLGNNKHKFLKYLGVFTTKS